MRFWALLCSIGICAAAGMFTNVPAQAKTVNLGLLSRNTIDIACRRANGSPYGISEDGQNYGCRTGRAVVLCLPDSTCTATVSELRPMTGNSLNLLLGTEPTGSARKIVPIDRRVLPTP